MAATGTLVVTKAAVPPDSNGRDRGVTKITLAWTSDASGNVNTNPFAGLVGFLHQLKIVPGTGGTVPTASYGVKLVDVDTLDLLSGAGLAQSATVPLLIVFQNGLLLDGSTTLDLIITAAGNAKTGTVTLWIR
jgi:hypothetical protein